MQPLPGFRDFYPEDCACRNFIFTKWREIAKRYNFVEFDGPPLESLELYAKKNASGSEILSQVYQFQDRGNRAVALRPEMTPTFARMVAVRHRDYKKPLKWFTIPQLFRYERQQKGRLREHFQFNADLVGANTVAEDVEMIALLIDLLRHFNLTERDFCLRISSREWWHEMLAKLDIDLEKHGEVFAVIDKVERLPREELEKKLVLLEIPSKTISFIFETLKQESPEKTLLKTLTGQERLKRLFSDLESIGLSSFVRFDPKIIRGLAYYTGVVFEAFALDEGGQFTGRAIAGGGRYDQLLALNGVNLPAIGFGLGDVVLGDLLQERGLISSLPQELKVFVAYPHEEYQTAALKTVHQLRSEGISTDHPFKSSGLGKQLEMAENVGAHFAIICDAKYAEGIIEVKTLSTRTQEVISLEQLIGYLRQKVSEFKR